MRLQRTLVDEAALDERVAERLQGRPVRARLVKFVNQHLMGTSWILAAVILAQAYFTLKEYNTTIGTVVHFTVSAIVTAFLVILWYAMRFLRNLPRKQRDRT